MDDQNKKAFDFAADLTKQLITLSTSIVTLTLLFNKDLLEPRWMAVAIWILFLLSTICGLWTLMALTGTLAPLPAPQPLPDQQRTRPPENSPPPDPPPLPIGENVRKPSSYQIVTFGLAVLLTIIYVPVAVLLHKRPPPPPTACCTCSCPLDTSKP